MAIVDVPSYPIDRGPAKSGRRYFLGSPFDPLTHENVLDMVRNAAPGLRFRYIVTPNVDHVVRLQRNGGLGQYYKNAWISVCDSRPIAGLARLLFLKLPVVTGSDLTAGIFSSVIRDGDLITLIAPHESVVRDLRARYPGVQFRACLPPHGIWDNPEALEACVEFAVAAEARFLFIAVGSPQSEKIAYELSRHPEARGIGLCIGASLEFLVGAKRRAPVWMRRSGLEWLHRLCSDPRRLWRRYVYAVLPLAMLFYGELIGRGSRLGPG
ncbi:WecB/TagA/CpsF family glycosyltransferase [Rhizobium terrae]|uniref:WecB/TagA/CpsF family glycosyltransferase n=1 Tax=Rhizobium terrae TaxID=2171756 RepID=UPI000E3B971C|nr:WecB/TagA/CpsF family glycosyltransferase [Rhizobium terrae]